MEEIQFGCVIFRKSGTSLHVSVVEAEVDWKEVIFFLSLIPVGIFILSVGLSSLAMIWDLFFKDKPITTQRFQAAIEFSLGATLFALLITIIVALILLSIQFSLWRKAFLEGTYTDSLRKATVIMRIKGKKQRQEMVYRNPRFHLELWGQDWFSTASGEVDPQWRLSFIHGEKKREWDTMTDWHRGNDQLVTRLLAFLRDYPLTYSKDAKKELEKRGIEIPGNTTSNKGSG